VTALDAAVWVAVCRADQVPVERGVAALIAGEQVAVFRTFDGVLFAVGNQDPFSGVYILSRGIVGSRGAVPTVSSPLHKQVFDLRTGRCLDSDDVVIPTYAVRERDGCVEVCIGTKDR
jgi:nitrite reductase (NADH) small subunit